MKHLAPLLVLLSAIAAASPANAQISLAPIPRELYEEDFDTGVPPDWTQLQFGWDGDEWEPGFSLVDGTPDLYHEHFCDTGFLFRDNIAFTPAINLSCVDNAKLVFDQDQVFSINRTSNTVEVSIDGGQNFTVIYTENGIFDGTSTVSLDLAAFVGLPDVRIGFHYVGTVANQWSIDNVRVTSDHFGPTLEASDPVAGGSLTIGLSNFTPHSPVRVGYSLTGGGPVSTMWGCVSLSGPVKQLPAFNANSNGNAIKVYSVPSSALGRRVWLQALNVATGKLSNGLSKLIE